MSDEFKDILDDDLKKIEDIDKKLQEKLGVSLQDMSEALCTSLKERAEEVAEDCYSLAPYGDYSKMTEDRDTIVKFLKEEAAKPEHWKLEFIQIKKKGDQIIEFLFKNSSVDDGDILKGFVFVGMSGKIRHAFCQVHT